MFLQILFLLARVVFFATVSFGGVMLILVTESGQWVGYMFGGMIALGFAAFLILCLIDDVRDLRSQQY